jgi:hypothetical protein
MTSTLTDPRVALTHPLALIARLKTGKPDPLQIVDIAHASVDDQPAASAGLDGGGEEFAEEPVLALGGAGGDEDVTVVELLDRDVEHPVVPGLKQDGDRRSAQASTAPSRPQGGAHQPDPAHRLVHGRDPRSGKVPAPRRDRGA